MRWFHVEPTAVPPPSGVLTLEFDNIANAPVADPNNVADWNTLFLLPTLGSEFTSVTVTGNIVQLFNTGTIQLKAQIFAIGAAPRTWLIRFIDTDIVENMGLGGNSPNHFRDHTALVEARMPISTNIQASSFSGCTSLQEAIFPEVLVTIRTTQGSSFTGCTSLTIVDMPKCEILGTGTFRGCSSLSNVKLPLVQDIFDTAFFNCSSLPSIDAPFCTTIRSRAFENCSSLAEVNFPLVDNLSGLWHFRNCSSLLYISLPLVEHTSRVCDQCTSLIHADFPICKTFGSQDFQSCINLESVNAPLLEIIGVSVFLNTPKLEGVNFPELVEVGTLAFFASPAAPIMTYFIAPKLERVLGNQVFRRRTGLTTINLGLCTELGASTGSDNIFANISGNTITCTLPVGTRTDGDAVALAAANTVTFLP